MMKRLLFTILFALAPYGAFAQAVQQSGTVTPNQGVRWVSNGIIGTSGTAADGLLSGLGITSNGNASFCISSARASAAGRNQLCFGASTTAAAVISLQNYGSATAQDLQFNLNGTTLTLPSGGGTFLTGTGAFVAGHAACFNNTTGVIQDCGVTLAAGTAFGLSYYSAAATLASTSAGTNGQVLVATTSAAPNWRTLSGDVSAVSAAGAVTLGSVNGVTFSSTYTANGVLIGNGTGAFVSSVSANTGYCLLSQGLSANPIWAACASGSGSAGGSTTQVQFNNASSLGGSANLTWVSPALTVGVAGTTTGQLALASSTATGTVTLQAPGVAVAYNFNYPTGAGSSGQPLLSGGGGSTPNTFGTLGIAGGGTNAASASGTALDNITGFSSTGYLNRTGAGTYAFSTVIPVSGGGTNLASGTSGGVLGYTASGTLASSAALAVNGVVIGGGAGATPTAITACSNGQLVVGATSAAPVCQTLSGDITTVTSGGAVTIAANAITNAKLATAAAYTLKGNFTGSTAVPTDTAVGSLTQKASPAAGDYLLVVDNVASGQMKYATVASVASAGSVSSIAGNTGAFTLTLPITNATNAILLNATIPAQGRLTLTTAVPVMTTTVSAATTVYYTPYVGNLIPVYDGTNVIATSFAEVSQATTDNTKSPAVVANNSNYDIFCWIDAGTNRCTRGPAWTSGTARGTGAGTTELVRVNGLMLNAVTITNGPVAQRGTYVGTIRSNGTASIDWIFGASAVGGTAGSFGVWNAYNRRLVASITADSTNSWTYATAAWQAANGNATMRTSFIVGLDDEAVATTYNGITSATSTTSRAVGVGLDTTTGFVGSAALTNISTGITQPLNGKWNGTPGIGFHFISANEYGGTNVSFYGNAGGAAFVRAALHFQFPM